jgi:FG-GAP-like repeat/ASPIC and UnbV
MRMMFVGLLALAGGAAAGQTAGHRRMVEALADVARLTTLNSRWLGTQRLDELRVEALRPEVADDPKALFEVSLQLGLEEAKVGAADAAIPRLGRALAVLRTSDDPALVPLRTLAEYYLAVAYIRRAERENCVAEHMASSCIFPIRADGVHRKQESGRLAASLLTDVVRSLPPTTVEYVDAQWLLNIVAMTLGEWPDGVPADARIDPSHFRSEAPFPRFLEDAQARGVATFDEAGGAVIDDLDGDGLVDLLTSSWRPTAPMHFFHQTGEGRFEERTAETGLEGITGGLNMIHADYDNDGDLDVFVLRGAWLWNAGYHPNSLLANDGRGHFTDVTFEAGLAEINFPTQTAAWSDYDNDGDLDLYVGNESYPGQPCPSQLFQNDGRGHFTDVAAQAGVQNLLFSKGVTWGDYDRDRFPDLYVSNFHGPNRLYRNLGDGTFEDLAPTLGVTAPDESFPTWFWDFDNDGELDIYVSSYPDAEGPARLFLVATRYLGLTSGAQLPRLYKGDGRGGFVDVAPAAGLAEPSMTMGANFGDLDNDGFPDVYLGTGYPAYDGLMPNVLYQNLGGRQFAEVTSDSGLGHLQKGHAVVFADVDGDGDQDVFEQLGGFLDEDAYANALFVNPGFGNHWLEVRLVGRQSNRFGLGARLRADIVDGAESRSVYATVGAGGSFGSNPLASHLGLGAARRVERLEVYWPTSDTTQTLGAIDADQGIEIVEGVPGFRSLAGPPRAARSATRAPARSGGRSRPRRR